MNDRSNDSLDVLVDHALNGPGLTAGSQIGQARMIALDTAAVGVAGSRTPLAAALRQQLPAWGRGEAAGILGSGGGRHPAASAAFMNAYQIHGTEYDCVHEPAVVHPMAAVFATALAAWDERRRREPGWGLSGQEWLDVLSRSTDVAIAVGLSARQAMRFFRPAVASAFGAVAAVSQIRALDPATAATAFGHLYSQLCGTMQAHAEGAAVLPMQIGFNARNALVAADLAQAGISAPAQVFEGAFGYLTLYESAGDLGPALDALAQVRRIPELSYKPFPTGRATHGGVDGLLRLRRAHEIDWRQVRAAKVFGPPLIPRLVGRPLRADHEAHYARLCMAFVGAVALRRGHIDLDDFLPASLADPETLALAGCITVHDDGNPDTNVLLPQRVEVELKDGRRHECTLSEVYGSPAVPMDEEAHWRKIRHCLAFGGLDEARVEAFVGQGAKLEQLADVAIWLDTACVD